jgi:gliding motility-associated-like protein
MANLFKILLCVVAFVLGNKTYAQAESNIWYFGDEAGLDFNSGAPVAITDGQMDSEEGCASVSDSQGNLLFYTNGIDVWDKQHNIMPNGSGLLGHVSTTQGSIAVPHPGNPNQYYIFAQDDSLNNDGELLSYSILDMTLNGGLGDITSEKNIILESETQEKLATYIHQNGEDIWIIAHRNMTNEFLSYLITDAGLNTIPVISSVGVGPGAGNLGIGDSIGQMKISPDGTKIAYVMAGTDYVEIFEFDNVTGVISTPILIPDFNTDFIQIFGLEFSPSNQFMYISAQEEGLYQFDVTNYNQADILASKIFIPSDYEEDGDISTGENLGLQLGPDGKIYVAHQDFNYIGAVNNPDLQGIACDYVFNAVDLGGKLCIRSFIHLQPSYFFNAIIANNGCLGNPTSFSVNTNQTIDNILWDFGDGNSSTLEEPNYTYANAGTYDVNATITSGSETLNLSRVVTIFENPILNTNVSLTQCDDDTDGISTFNLTETYEALSVNFQNESFGFYTSQFNAENSVDIISNPSTYQNRNPSTETLWVRVENQNNCHSVISITLNVATTQIPDAFQNELYACDDGSDTTDGIATFNLSSFTQDVEALFPSNQNLDINYYRNQDDALSENNPIVDLSNYQNTGFPTTQDIYIRVEDESNNCIGLGHHITLNVLNVPVANTVDIDEQCDDDGDGLFAFDTSTIQDSVLNGQTGVSVEYYDEADNLLPSPLPNPFMTSSQDITVRVINTNPLSPETSCTDETIINFSVQQAVTANPVSVFSACDDDNDGVAQFDVSDLESQLLNGQNQVAVVYTDSEGNALPSPLPNPFETSTASIIARVESTINTICFDETVINFEIFAQPLANPVEDVAICDALNDISENILLSNFNTQILGSQSASDFEVLYFENATDAELNQNSLQENYQINSTQQDVYARIQHVNNDSCYDTLMFQITLSQIPQANTPPILTLCDDATNDQVEFFNSNVQDEFILDDQNADDNNITYHLTQNDADFNLNPLPLVFENSSNPQSIYVRLENNTNTVCYTTTSFETIIYETPNAIVEDFYTLCDGASISIGIDNNFDDYLWSTGEASPQVIVDTPGTYDLNIINAYEDTNCENTVTFNVISSNPPTILDVTTRDWSGNNFIEVSVEGNGDYEYSLDGINYQDSNRFQNLTDYEYLVHIRDKNGCGETLRRVYLLDYPQFFTPNGDGFNDRWQIINAKQEIFTKIYIFDRYGKLVADLKPGNSGWDGTFNGNLMPSNDYWFKVEREDGRIHTGHFTLKR